MRTSLLFTALLVAGCDDSGSPGRPDAGDAPRADAGDAAADTDAACEPDPPASLDCGAAAGACAALAVSGDAPSPGPGTFHGFADPSLSADLDVPDRVWLAYSWPHLVAGQDPDGTPVAMAAVENHLARSDDGGESFSFVGELWPATPAADPEGTAGNGLIASETASLVAIESAGATTWYGAHLVYFLRPETGYHPNYATSWTVRIAAAPSPDALSSAPETVLGVSATAAVYGADASLDQRAGLPLQHCAMLNNPTLFAQGGTLYLVVECLAFVGPAIDFANSTVQVFATTPAGAPSTWAWRHAGQLADDSLADELGDDTIQQPDVSLAADGTPLLIITPAHLDPDVEVGTRGNGCAAIELASIDPPALARDCDGRAIVRAHLRGAISACTHDAASATGIIGHLQGTATNLWSVRVSGARP